MKPVIIKRITPSDSETGVALILVLWVISLLTIMASSFALTIKRETNLIANLRDHSKALAIAEAGITLAQLHLLLVDKEQRWRANGHIYASEFNGVKLRIKIQMESGKIDINKANEKFLSGMMKQTDVTEEKQQAIVNAILDWRDGDDLVRIDGAEARDYQAANLSYVPSNKAFQNIEELQLVLGITPELYKQIKPMITVYSKNKRVYLKNANRDVLLAVSGRDEATVDTYIAERLESDQNKTPAPNFISYRTISFRSSIVNVISEAQLGDGARARIQVIMQKDTTDKSKLSFKILDWKPYADLNTSLFSDTMTPLLMTNDAELNH
ncbi:MAG: general secretion pathway protein GspK [Methylococcales bacterium]|nr:general secretion pathway protein GspK [Methylococcales bacterium]